MKQIHLKPLSHELAFELVSFDVNGAHISHATEIASVLSSMQHAKKSWLHVHGDYDASVVEQLGKTLGLHPLTCEDILATNQQPKIEDHEEYLFIIFKKLEFEITAQRINIDQIALILFKNHVITFDLGRDSLFPEMKKRFEIGADHVHNKGVDYFAYMILDTVIDSYFDFLENISETIDIYDELLLKNPTDKTLHAIHGLKRKLFSIQKAVWPLRDIMGKLERGNSPFIERNTRLYFRDAYDHAIQIIDTVETLRELISNMLDLYHSRLSSRMNAVMKVFTTITTIFIPITFIVGIYGMNFKFMPELNHPLGYPAVMLIMLVVAVGMILYFKKKKWL